MITAIEISLYLARALTDSKVLEAAAMEAFGKPLYICVGFDPRKAEWGKHSPFAAFIPGSTGKEGSGRQVLVRESTIRPHMATLMLGVTESDADDVFGVPTLQGLTWLSANMEAAIAAMQQALPKALTGFRLEDPEIEFNFENYPLIFAELALTVRENLPIGSRR